MIIAIVAPVLLIVTGVIIGVAVVKRKRRIRALKRVMEMRNAALSDSKESPMKTGGVLIR